jgi:hypothetical protein
MLLFLQLGMSSGEAHPGCRNSSMTSATSLTGTAYPYGPPELIPGCRSSNMTGDTSLAGTAYPYGPPELIVPVKLVAPVMLLFLQPGMTSGAP